MKLDHIAVITTDRDPEFHKTKKRDVARSLDVTPEDVHVYCFDRHPEGPFRGCFESHQAVWGDIVRNGYEYSLILEDDVVFLRKTTEQLYADFLMQNKDWEIFYLGHRPIIWDVRLVRKTNTPGIVEVRTNDTHAYILNRQSAQRLSKMPWENKPVDIAMREFTTKSYAIFPMRAIQCGTLFTPSFFNGLSERNSQYIRYALQNPLHPLRALFYLLFVIVGQPWMFFTSVWFSLTRRHPR